MYGNTKSNHAKGRQLFFFFSLSRILLPRSQHLLCEEMGEIGAAKCSRLENGFDMISGLDLKQIPTRPLDSPDGD